MKKLVVTVVLVAALLIVLTGTALADNGPHGSGYGSTTDACAGCHRAHTATGPKLLTTTNTATMCLSCHGSTATGADTNVIDGVYVERDGNVEPAPGEGAAGKGLLAGGFTNAVMDSDANGTSASAPIGLGGTHIYDGATGTVWGYGAISATANNGLAAFSLGCGNCHNPHGKSGTGGAATYRILRSVVTGFVTNPPAADVADQAAKMYTVSDANNNYFGQNYGGTGAPLASWCAQCHTRYLAGANSAITNSGDAVFTYRHMSNTSGINCTSCHVAHGSSAASSTLANSASLALDGAMLRLDNRGVCQACHAK